VSCYCTSQLHGEHTNFGTKRITAPKLLTPGPGSVCNKEVKFVQICSPEGRDLVSVVRFREGPYHRGFFEEMYENFVGT